LSISTQWAYDIVQEFVYQFQGFCQYRCQVANLSGNAETIKVLDANKDAWNLPEVTSILKKLIRASKASSSVAKSTPFNAGPFIAQFGYFATIELARLECLTGDFGASLAAISSIKLSDRSELFVQLPLCHFNVFYHTGVCHLLLRKFSTAADVLSEIILHVSRALKPGAAGSLRAGLQTQLQRMLDKAVALTAIASFLCPSYRLDDQVKEIVDAKYSDKIQKLQNAESLQKVLTDLFDFSAPKFISPSVPDYSVAVNSKQNTPNHILASFLVEVEQHQTFMKLKSFLGLYASIELDKLARFNDSAEADIVCQLVSAKNKGVQQRSSGASQRNDVHYFVDQGAVIIDSSSAKSELNKAQERFFVAGVRKHAEIAAQINKAFAAVGLE
jgi:translation initiation factor 3 subunit L